MSLILGLYLRPLANVSNFDSMFISRGMVEFDKTELIHLRGTPQYTALEVTLEEES